MAENSLPLFQIFCNIPHEQCCETNLFGVKKNEAQLFGLSKQK